MENGYRLKLAMQPDFPAGSQQLFELARQSLFEHFADLCEGLVIVDAGANIVWMNDSYPRRLGIADPAAMIGRPIEDAIPNSQMRHVVDTGKPIMLDIMDFGSESFVVTRLPLRDAQRRLAEARRTRYTFVNFVGVSFHCLELKQAARRAARTTSPVLILGETGTGKELLAQAIHAASPRAEAPFIAVNIAAVPETLLEAEFFGVAPGAYTGAERKGRDGKFKLADGGTLFLDEIGDMSLALQAKLLRTLQERELEPVGSNRLIPVNVRVIAATSRNLEAMVADGSFRADLYYRLNVICLVTPPLRERLDDIPELANHYLQAATADGLPTKVLSPDAMARLKQHRWPGNVRELVNLVRRLSALYSEEVIGVETIEAELADAMSALEPAPVPADLTAEISLADAVDRHLQGLFAAHGDRLPPDGMYDRVISEVERPLLSLALGATRGNQLRAARLLGLNRNTLRKKIKDLDVPVVRTPQVRRGG